MATKSNKKTQKKQTNVPNMKKTSKTRKSRVQKKVSTMGRLKPLIDDIPSSEYDKIFEQKLADQYRVFRSLKENHLQTKKFIRILTILLVIIILAVLLISFS